MKHHQEQIEAKLERIFLNQIEALADTKSPPTSDDEKPLEDFGEDFERELEDELLAGSPKKRRKETPTTPRPTKRSKTSVSDEEEAFNNFLKDENLPDQALVTETTKTINVGAGEKVGDSGLIRIPHEPVPNQKYYLKRTRTIMDEVTESTAKRIDIITNADEVKQLLERQKRQRGGSKRFRLQLSEEEEQKRVFLKKEKRRLQEKFRRQRKIQENQRILQERYKQGSKDGTLPGGSVRSKCGRCGMFGHMKTNKSCPVYVHDEEESNEKKETKPEKEKE
jgi:transcription initiation factor TFIID subunit 1